jgi:hypothetical protein
VVRGSARVAMAPAIRKVTRMPIAPAGPMPNGAQPVMERRLQTSQEDPTGLPPGTVRPMGQKFILMHEPSAVRSEGLAEPSQG